MLDFIEKTEVFRYLGYKTISPDEKTGALIDECIDEMMAAAKPAVIYSYFNIKEDMCLENTVLALKGHDIKRHLRGCEKCVLMAATLGLEAERIIVRRQVTDMTRALILDACATAAIERVCDNLCAEIGTQVHPFKLTERFSPGYGDLPIETQTDFIAVLDAGRKIGLTVTNDNIMIPRKSVTAVVGISKTAEKNKQKCETCKLKHSCNYRKEGISCE